MRITGKRAFPKKDGNGLNYVVNVLTLIKPEELRHGGFGYETTVKYITKDCWEKITKEDCFVELDFFTRLNDYGVYETFDFVHVSSVPPSKDGK